MDGGMEGETLSEILYISVRKVGDSCISAGRRRLDFGDTLMHEASKSEWGHFLRYVTDLLE